MSGNLWSVVFGAGLTLLATVFVQSLVVPWTQARLRRRERWEDTVHELSTLLEDQLPRELREYHACARAEEVMASIKEGPEDERVRVKAVLNSAVDRREKAEEALGLTIDRMNLYVDRVKHIRRRAPYWSRLDACHVEFLKAWVNMIVPRAVGDDVDEDERERLWREQDKTLKEFVAVVQPLAVSMKPPKRRALRRG